MNMNRDFSIIKWGENKEMTLKKIITKKSVKMIQYLHTCNPYLFQSSAEFFPSQLREHEMLFKFRIYVSTRKLWLYTGGL